MKIAYITAKLPWGKGETFLIDEIKQIKQLGNDILIVPRNPTKKIFHRDAVELARIAFNIPLLNLKILFIFLFKLINDKNIRKVLGKVIHDSRKYKITIKNLFVFPKSVYLSYKLKEANVEHIHAHWGSTTATMAYIISNLTGIPWSMTLHRWDIGENNMLRTKVDHSQFTRCISEDGRDELISIVGDYYKDKIKKVYMGVKIDNIKKIDKIYEPIDDVLFKIICPANLVEKKGHIYLFKALKVLLERGITDFKCDEIGTGPLEKELKELVIKLGLRQHVKFCGHVSHDSLMSIYQSGEVDAVVLPSITVPNGEREGIPVSLMEAMAYSIPVISTRTGGIPELLEGVGLLVNEKDYKQIADSLEKLILNKNIRMELGEKGHKKVIEYFDINKNTNYLLSLMKMNN